MNRRYEIPYGKRTLEFTLPESAPVETLSPKEVAAVADASAEVVRALRSPLSVTGRETELRRIAASDSTVAIAVNDKTRPVPHGDLLPPLVEYLLDLGYRRENIVFVIATGTHPVMTPGEYPAILPQEILRGSRVECHDGYDDENLVFRGTTSRGTPAWFNRTFAEADARIVVGNIEPHQFMGYSGGVKSAAIGLAGAETINVNHARMMEPAARLGSYEGNPAREDVEELGRLLGIHFALNAVLNDHKQIVRALAGDPVAVMSAGIPLVRSQFELPIGEQFDLMIVSPGGHPKDINLYQAQKALAHASLVTREGGAIILAAACPEGSGSSSYEKWVSARSSSREVLDDFGAGGFRVGPHKAFQIARDAIRAHVILVSELSDEQVRRFILEPAGSIDEAIDRIGAPPEGGGRIGIMPYANATIPRIASS